MNELEICKKRKKSIFYFKRNIDHHSCRFVTMTNFPVRSFTAKGRIMVGNLYIYLIDSPWFNVPVCFTTLKRNVICDVCTYSAEMLNNSRASGFKEWMHFSSCM